MSPACVYAATWSLRIDVARAAGLGLNAPTVADVPPGRSSFIGRRIGRPMMNRPLGLYPTARLPVPKRKIRRSWRSGPFVVLLVGLQLW